MRQKILTIAAIALAISALVAQSGAAVSAPESSSQLDRFSAEIAKELSSLSTTELSGVSRTAQLMPFVIEVEELKGFVDSGYETSEGDVAEVLWKGPHTAELEAAIDRATKRGLEVKVVDVPHTAAELDSVIDEVAKALDANFIGFDSLGPSNKFDSLNLVLVNAKERVAAVEQLANEHSSGIPVVVSNRDVAEDAPANGFYDTRIADTGAIETGATIRHYFGSSDYGYCGTGLAYSRAGYGDYLLTAAHCSAFVNDLEVYSNSLSTQWGTSRGLGIFWGASSGDSDPNGPRLDAGLVDLTSRTTSAQIWVGDWDTSTKGDVNFTSTIPYNTAMCSSGSLTGLHCNLERVAAQELTCINRPGSVCLQYAKTVQVNSTDNKVMFGSGDSGGPIYTYTNYDRYMNSIVEGSVIGANYYCSASDHHFGPGNADNLVFCSRQGGKVTALSSITTALSGLGFVVKTTP